MSTDLRSEIANRAYSIWKREGRPDGKEVDHWLQAEAEISDEIASNVVDEIASRVAGETASKVVAAKPKATIPRRSGRKPAAIGRGYRSGLAIPHSP